MLHTPSEERTGCPRRERVTGVEREVICMSDKRKSIEEPARQVPVVFDGDVVVAGAGVAGVFAAVAAARRGAETLVIDRFGFPGGNMGPGMITGGGFHETGPLKTYPFATPVYGDLAGIPREFIERYSSYGGGAFLPYRNSLYARDSGMASQVAIEMLEEAGVKMLLSTQAADPVREGNSIRGVYIENKSGRRAALAKVTIDATGEADLARRAGLPVLQPKKEYHELDQHSPNGMGIWAVLGGIDCDRYAEAQKKPVEIEERKIGSLAVAAITPGLDIEYLDNTKFFLKEAGIAGFRVKLLRPDSEYDPGNGEHISELEIGVRKYIWDTVQVFRKSVPGFEDAYVISIAPFLGTRGGPCITGDYTLTMDDLRKAKRFDDVINLYGETRALAYHLEKHGEYRWTDMPYRVMIPKGVDGMMAVGRSASGIPDTLLRNRMAVMHMGQAGGTAAALAAENNVSPRDIDIRQLQGILLDAGFYLGDRGRLTQLGLA